MRNRKEKRVELVRDKCMYVWLTSWIKQSVSEITQSLTCRWSHLYSISIKEGRKELNKNKQHNN